jgi:hypothetical protein
MNKQLTEYQNALHKFMNELEKQLEALSDSELIHYFNNAKKHVVEQPDVESNVLKFYTNLFEKEYEFLMLDKTNDLENSINILVSVSSKLKDLEINKHPFGVQAN